MTGLIHHGCCRLTPFSALAALTCAAGAAHAATRNVPGDYPTIQSAIQDANAFDIIEVEPGVYPEQIDFMGKSITVRSTGGAEVTFLDGQQQNTVVFFVNAEPATAVLEGFTIADGEIENADGGGIYILGASPTIKDCVIASNETYGSICGLEVRGGGVFAEAGSPTFINCTFLENRAYPAAICGIPRGGALFVSGGVFTFNNCAFEGNYVWNRDGGAIYADLATVNLNNCTFTENWVSSGEGGAIFSTANSVFNINGCAFTGNYAEYGGGGAISATGSSILSIVGAVFEANDSREGGGPGAIQIEGATLDVTGSTFTANKADGGSGAAIGAEDSLITVTGSAFTDNWAVGGAGAGIAMIRGTLEVSDSTFTDNRASGGYGAGVANGITTPGTGGTAVIENCHFENNEASMGAVTASQGVTTVRGSTFTRNDAPGSSNAAAGARAGGRLDLDRCYFYKNGLGTGNGIIGTYESGTLNATNCVFNANSPQGGIARMYEGGTVTLANCTLYNSEVLTSGAHMIFVYDNSPTLLTDLTIVNCIIRADNSQGQQIIRKYGAWGALSVTYSNIKGGYAGIGNIDAVPLFALINGGDNVPGTIDDNFALISGSPGIDAGSNAAVPAGVSLDFAGLVRIVRGLPGAGPDVVDMGAHEFPGASQCPGDATGDNVVNFSDLNLVIATWGQSVLPGTGGDIAPDGNPDGLVDFADLNQVISTFGTSCN